MSTDHGNHENGEQGAGHGGDHEPKAKKDWRKFRKYFLAAGLLLAALLTWWLWPASEEAPIPAPVVTKAPTPVVKPVVMPDPLPLPAAPTPAAAPTPPPKVDEVTTPVTHEVIGGIKKRCVTTMLNGIEVQKDCFSVE
jgi:hypothetical protein